MASTDRSAPEDASATSGVARDAVAAQQSAFGGTAWGAAFFGWLSATGLAVLLVALVSAADVALGLTEGASAGEMGLGGAVALLVVLFLSYLAGGYVAGRMARFTGFRQGLAVWLVGLVVVLLVSAAAAALGSEYNVLARLELPRIPVEEGTATTAGLVTLAAAAAASLVGALLGGGLGTRYHRKVDRAGFAV
ncbi:hypothetical protein SAMN05660350_03559 [Geodermatophilus obscurus]|uniref:Uncharacterized protein n=1 Tax=Geodermatophilus obscurus TaxID=1861 RepID=A0A1M7UMM0_9ACTN|nr:hypothetical protein [Geodermatophilus obscurus]SHN84136.1 hypothetical protein SAMN05660350_03559 [Geodermatophilus obscurus]